MARTYKPATFQPTIRPDWGGTISYIPNEEKALILEAMLKYPSIECDARFWLETIKPEFDFQYSEFLRICEQKSRGVRNRWGKTSITDVVDMNNTCNRDVIDSKRKDKSKSKEERENKSKFKKPTIEEISAYCLERNNNVDEVKFYNYYESNGWKVGKNPMKDWKACVRTWESNSKQTLKPSKQDEITAHNRAVYEKLMMECEYE